MADNKSMIEHFRQLLEEGEVPSDPFQDAVDRATAGPTDAEKARMRLSWNNSIMMRYGGDDAMRTRMLRRRMVRSLNGRR